MHEKQHRDHDHGSRRGTEQVHGVYPGHLRAVDQEDKANVGTCQEEDGEEGRVEEKDVADLRAPQDGVLQLQGIERVGAEEQKCRRSGGDEQGRDEQKKELVAPVKPVPGQGEDHPPEGVAQESHGDDPVAVVREEGEGEVATEEQLEGQPEKRDEEEGDEVPGAAHQPPTPGWAGAAVSGYPPSWV